MRFAFSRFLWAVLGGLLGSLPTHTLRAQSFGLPAPQRLTEREGLPQAYVPAIVQDRQGFIWVATRDGLCRYDGNNFKVFQPDPDGRPSLSYAGISNLTLDHRGRIWIGSERGDIDVLDPLTEKFVNISRQPAYRRAMRGEQATFFRYDRQDRLWAAKAESGEVLRYDFKNRRVKRFVFKGRAEPTTEDDIVTDLAQDASGRVWLTSTAGLKYLDPDTDKFKNYALPEHQGDYPRRLCVAREALLVFYSRRVVRLNTRSGATSDYPYPGDDHFWKNRNFVSDSLGRIYFNNGSTLFGLTARDGVRVLSRRDPKALATHGIGLWLDRSGVLWEGSSGAGIRKYDLSQVNKEGFDPPIEITKIWVNNRPVPPAVMDSLPAQAVQKVVLYPDQNFVTVEFAALQFNRSAARRPGKKRYRYRLEGLEGSPDDWVETDQPVATYTNLPSGKYALLLNASNTSGQWSKHVRHLTIRIRKSVWNMGWARLLYTLTAAGLVFLGVRMYFNRLRLRQTLALQKQTLALKEKEVALKAQEAEQLRAVDEMKSDFFANITHEFRTPLTLILGPTEQLHQKFRDPEDQLHLSAIDRNAQQLLGLVNQLLDLSKLEAGALPVVEMRGNLTQFVAQSVDSFRELARAKGVELVFKAENLADEYWFDAEKLESILNNLLANALNYGEEGPVEVVLSGTNRQEAEGVKIAVADAGPGIAADQLPRIFDRYYRVGSAGESALTTDELAPAHRPVPQPQGGGTGLGLALVRELVGLQRGEISVTSEVGRGSVFVVSLPYRPVREPETTLPNAEIETVADKVPARDPAVGHGQPLVLVVEDHDELAQYIVSSLPADYRVLRATDGQQGWEMALAELPDLILSDVMMPVMDGYELCQKLSTDLRTSHIPVLMLTAKASTDDRLEGLELGADDYLPKPFRVDELRLRVRNQLAQRQRLRERLRAELSQPTETNEVLAETTDPFLRQLYTLLEAQLDNPKFGAAQLLDPLGLSRPTLYRKLKALTDMSPAVVVRLYRLRRAAHFLRQGMSATDTAYRVGFQTPSHFAKAFRAQYRVTPSEFARQEGED